MSNSDIEQSGTVKGHLPNGANLSGRISNVVSLSGHISIGSVAGDFIIKMTVESDDNGNYTVTSCDTTIEQIDAAVAAEKRVIVIASEGDTVFELPMIQGIKGRLCIFGTFLGGQVLLSSVYKGDEGGSYWEFMATSIHARNVDYSNAAMPNISTVADALDELVPKSHIHTNKDTLDKLSGANGKLQYNGSDVGLKGADGKSAYQYAQEGGYTGTETEFAEKLASGMMLVEITENNGTLSADKSYLEIIDAIRAGRPAFVSWDGIELPFYSAYNSLLLGESSLFFGGVSCQPGSTEAPVSAMTVEITPNDEVNDYYDVVKTLPNPNAITFTGAVTGSYDGSAAMTVNIPSAVTDGITPTIGANGNWYLDTTDTGKPSRGEKGDKGDPGSDANVTKDNVVAALGYTPEAVSAQVTTGSNITLADNTEYRLTNVTTLNLTYPTDNFECWMRLTFAASGDATVTLPVDTKYLGAVPNFKKGETWELGFKDKVLAAQKVGDGT